MIIVETSIFTRRVLELLTDEEYRKLQVALINRPNSRGRISMKEELFDELVASVREGSAILRSQAKPSRAFVADGPNIKRVRANYRLSQGQFAALLGISVGTLRNWEQGRRTPDGPARVLLQVAAKHPDVVWDVIRPATRQQRSAVKATRAKRTI